MALQGLKVLDLTRLLPGPLCTHFLSRLGAQVIKVEGVESDGQLGDYTRVTAPPLFETLNAGKKGIAINLRDEAGKNVFRRLVENADILVEGNRPGVMKRLGLDYDSLKLINKRLIYCSISGYGATGPLSHRAGHDLNYQSIAGLLGISGKESSVPPLTGFQPADGAGAMNAAMGIMAAVIGRFNSGEGQFVDISLCESSMSLGVVSLSSALHGNPTARGTGFLDGGLPQYNIYETLDHKYISVGALEEHFWMKVVHAIQTCYPELPTTTFKTTESVAQLISMKSFDEWMTVFEGLDACVEPVFAPEEVFQHPQHVARQVVLPASESAAKQLVLGPRLSAHPMVSLPKAPRLGQHTRELLQHVGVSDTAIVELLTSKSVQQAKPQGKCTQQKPYRHALEKGKDYWWCSCGKSNNQPFCDGSHKGTSFAPIKVAVDEDGLFPFCGCRKSDKGARCDGAHKRKPL